MPHRRRSLLRGPLGMAPAALILVLACSSGSAGDKADTAAPSRPAQSSDPGAELDREFQRARSALNAEAGALSRIDRASPEYTTRYEAWLRDAAAAESIRTRRDSLRRSTRSAAPAT